MSAILAIDPGYECSAVVQIEAGRPTRHWYETNSATLAMLSAIANREGSGMTLVAERIASYGMAVGAEVFETCVWTGRFIQAWEHQHGTWDRLYRRDVKLHLCGSARAKDANVRAALLDRFGPGREQAIGTKRKPGPCFGITGDCWAALAVAVTYYDKQRGMVAPRLMALTPAAPREGGK